MEKCNSVSDVVILKGRVGGLVLNIQIETNRYQAWMAEEGGEESLLAMIGADPKQLAEAGDLDSPRNSTG